MASKKFPSGQFGRQRFEFHSAPFKAPLRPFAVMVIPWQNNQILLCDIENRGWCIPGGRVEPLETSLEAAHRETLEEGGALLGTMRYIGCYKMIERTAKKIQVRWADTYVAKVEELVALDPQFESKGRQFVPLEELPNIYYQWNPLVKEVLQYSKEVLRRLDKIQNLYCSH